MGQYSGLASMAGLSLPGSGDVSKSVLAMEVVKSRVFAESFIRRHGILPELFAVDFWDSNTRQLEFDSKLYDTQTGQWSKDENQGSTPSKQEAYREFQSILGVYQNPDTDLITISIKHESPDIAKQWVEWLIQDVDETMRQKEIKEAEESIKYLERQAAETRLADPIRCFSS